MDEPVRIAFTAFSLGFSCIFHEQMHARSAYLMGDPTGKDANRFSWNPIHHIDPWMTIALPAILYFSTQGRFIFGGGKPCPVNPSNFRNPSLGMCISAGCGPASNLFLAAVAFGILALLFFTAPQVIWQEGHLTFNGLFFCIFMWTNVGLAAFNMLPLPGLDGSRVLRYFLPRGAQVFMDSIEPFAMMITVLAVYLGATRILVPVYYLFFDILEAAFGYKFNAEAIKALVR